MKRRFALLPLLLIAACENAPASGEIPSRLREDVYWLADDVREGRLPGTPGADAAAKYIAQRFADLKLAAPPGVDDYRQAFPLPPRITINPATSLAVSTSSFALEKDFLPVSISATGSFNAPVAFVGYGITSKEYGYDDFAGIGLKGRVAIVMRFEPHNLDGKSRFTGDSFSAAASLNAKAKAAEAQGASALLVVNPPLHHDAETPLRPFGGGGAVHLPASRIPIVSIAPQVAEQLIGQPLTPLQKKIDDKGAPASFLAPTVVRGEVAFSKVVETTSNVVAFLRGNGPQLDEFIVLGAHYDHVGRGHFGSTRPGSNQIHNGADDNASGTAALLALAERLSKQKLNRSILFVAFSAEEWGLIGSNEFVKNPLVPFDRMVAMINLDMVGRVRTDSLSISGAGTRSDFDAIVNCADTASPLKIKGIGRGGLGPSDHQSFALKQVPVLFLFSGLHEQYHAPDDDSHRINFTGLAAVVDFASDLVHQIDAAPKQPYVAKYDREAVGITSPMASSGSRASLGVIPDYSSGTSSDGVLISGTVPDSPAAKAGLMEGDQLTGWDEQEIKNLYDLTDQLTASRPGQIVTLRYTRGGQSRTVRVTLSERKSPS
ncbi:MAG TPA: M20/M25/M40 family metallo-hydrolase [Tepidisphaeraceae bacterium]